MKNYAKCEIIDSVMVKRRILLRGCRGQCVPALTRDWLRWSGGEERKRKCGRPSRRPASPVRKEATAMARGTCNLEAR